MKVLPQANNVIVHLIGLVAAWNSSTNPNPTITVNQGDMLSISLASGDTDHRFLLDNDKDGPGAGCGTIDVCSGVFPPSTSVSFIVNANPGTYTYYCLFHPTTMLGNFVVIASPPSGVGGATRLYQK